MRIKVLGCSGGVGPGLRTTSLLIDDKILIDAGTGVGDLSLAQMREIGHIFLTHSHLDHTCGLAFMADNLFDLIDRPLEVMARAETLDAVRRHLFNWIIWPDFSKLPTPENPLVRFNEVIPGQRYPLGSDCTLTPFDVLHTVPAVGYALETASGTFAFSGDTYATDKLWNFLNALPRLDLLMIEIAFPDEQAALGRTSGHFTPTLLAQELLKLNHRPRLLLTHAKPGAEAIIEGECRDVLRHWTHRLLKRDDIIEF